MHNFNVAIINGSYILRLQGSHHQAVYIRSMSKLYACCLHIVEND